MSDVYGKLLAMPRQASTATTLRRDQVISVYSPLAKSIALSIAPRYPACETADMVQIAMMEVVQQAALFDSLIRSRIEGAVRHAVDPQRRAGRAVLEFRHSREVPEVKDTGKSPESALIERQEAGFIRDAVARLSACDRKVLEIGFGKPRRGRPIKTEPVVAKVQRMLAVSQAA